MHGFDDVVRFDFGGPGEHHLGNHLGDVHADHVGAEEGVVGGIEDELDESFVGTGGAGLAGGGEGEFADFHLVAGLAGFGLGEAYGGHLGGDVGASRYVGVVHGRGVESGDGLDAADGLGGGDVGEGGASDDVADGVYAGDIGAVVPVDFDASAFGGDAEFLESDVLDVGSDSHGGEDYLSLVCFNLAFFVFDVDLEEVAVGVDALDGGFHHDFNAGFLEGAGYLLGHFLVLDGEHVGHELDEEHFGAHGVVEVGQLGAYGAAADDNHGGGPVVEGQRLSVADDAAAVLRDVGQLSGAGPGGEDDVGGLEKRFFSFAIGHFHFFVGGQFAGAGDDGDVVLFEQVLDAFAHFVGDGPAAGDDGGEVRLGGLDLHAVVGGVAGVFQHLRRFQERFRGDAAPVEANAPEFGPFDNGDVHS